MLWQFLSEDTPETIEELESVLLANREIVDMNTYFSPRHPLELSLAEVGLNAQVVKKAVGRIKRAAKNKEKVVIFGDYDADGISATAVLWSALQAIGLIAVPFIPRRDTHGYGITRKALDEILAHGAPSLLITVDNGIVAHDAIQYATDKGIEVILTDHHQPDYSEDGKPLFPSALYCIHTTALCGTTVSWMVAREISSENAAQQLDLTALATIADQVKLQGANRSFAFHGLQALQKTKRVGLKALSELAHIDLSTISSSGVGFSLAPRINAMGRLAHGLDALRLLCTANWDSARKLARTLASTNATRQELTQDQYEIALKQVALQKEESLLFVTSESFHEGVIGLIAGRLMEQFYKPALVVSTTKDVGKGSARSVQGVNIVELLRLVREDLSEVGGHPMAAGFGVTRQNIELVKSKLFIIAKSSIDEALLLPKRVVDCRLPFTMVSVDAVERINRFEPFGNGNPQPLFAIENCRVLSTQTVGKEKQHLKLLLCNSDDEDVRCEMVFWNKGNLSEQIHVDSSISVLAHLELSEWKGKQQVQLVARDVKLL